MKRLSIGLVIAVLIVSACTSGASPAPSSPATGASPSPVASPSVAAEPVTIKVVHQFGDAESDKFDEIVAAFQAANPTITVELERNNEQNYYDKLVTSILGGSAPDIARVEPPKAAQYVAAGYAADLSALVPADVRDDFFEGTLEPLTKDGALYGVPQDVAVLSLYYRTDLFEAAGIADPPATWDELVSAAKALTKGDVYGIGLFGGWGAFEFYPWFWQAGGEMLKDEGGQPTPAFNSPEGVAALQFWVDLVKTHKVMPEGTANQGEDEVKGPFIAGKIAMFTSGPWSLASLKEVSEIDGKWAVAPLPKGQQAASVLGGMDVILLEQSEHKAEAAKFLEFWLSEDVQLDWAKSLGFLPVRKSLYADSFFQSDPYIQAFAKELEVARSRPTIAQAGEIDDLFGKAVQAALSGAMTPQEALDDAAAKATEVLAGS
jgi:ABC-type glycerol-3-phosphate transport system substrate-binding protein